MITELKNSNRISIKVIIGSFVVTFILTVISLIANILQITSSPVFDKITSSEAIRFIPYVLNIVLLVTSVYLYFKWTAAKSSANNYFVLSNSLWKRYVRTLRSILLADITTPSIRDSLEPLLDELAKRLPENGIDFKIGLVRPNMDGNFKFLADRGMDPTSVHSMEKKSNWKEKKSFFSNGLDLPDERPFDRYRSGEQNYSNIQREKGVGTSVSHFVIAIKDPVYSDSVYPKKTVGVLSIGIPQKYDLSSIDEEDILYDRIFPVIKSIESILLNFHNLPENE